MQSDSSVKRAASEGPPPRTPPLEPLDPAQKLHHVAQHRLKQMQAGDTWYIVSRTWYRRWQAACQGIADKAGPLDEKDLGPVDNTPLLDRDANLVSNLTEGVDVEFVPWDVWKAFTTWCVVPLSPSQRVQSLQVRPRHPPPPSLRDREGPSRGT
jgi:ubiquitin carboxyl-terminal hydrolase 4/11/15